MSVPDPKYFIYKTIDPCPFHLWYRVTIDSGVSLDVFLANREERRPKQARHFSPVYLMIGGPVFKDLYDASDSIKIYDLLGNGQASGLQGKGIGSLLVNVALDFLQANYPGHLRVTGLVSDNSDRNTDANIERNAKRRRAFWQSFGFRIVPDHTPYPKLRATLSGLRARPGTTVLESIPRQPGLSTFEPVLPHA